MPFSKFLSDPDWWFSVVVAGTFASVVAALIYRPISRWLDDRRNAKDDRRKQLVAADEVTAEVLSKDEVELVIADGRCNYLSATLSIIPPFLIVLLHFPDPENWWLGFVPVFSTVFLVGIRAVDRRRAILNRARQLRRVRLGPT